MLRFLLLLLVVVLPSSTAPALLVVLVDSTSCLDLQCEFRGTGDHCNPAASLKEAFKTANGTSFKVLEHETENKLLKRLNTQYISNTFTIVRDINLGENCEEKALWCNAVRSITVASLDEYFKLASHLAPEDIPNSHC